MAYKGSANLPSFITGCYGPNSNSSRAFQSLVRAIGEAKSKHEEDRIIVKELGLLKDKLTQRDLSKKEMRENLVRLIYCQMLGHDVSSGYVEAIKFAEQQSTLDKRVGYLAASLFLHEDHELIVLLINTLQKDLKSANVMEVCCALTVVCKLINKDMMPALLPQVLQLLQSKRDIVRKKAVMALHSFYIKSPSSIPDLKEHAKKAIMDKDPGVMCASLQVFNELIKASPTECKDLVPAFVSLQKMIVEGKLAPEYDYHGVSSPWIQVKLLRMLGLLGADDQRASQKMYSVLGRTLTNLNTNSLISYAVAYECTRTITAIYPDKGLIGKAAKCVGIFLVAKTNDIKYIGITTLTSLLQVGSGFVMESAYQRFVIDCLDDPDETLKRKTLDLLCHITNASNVETVCEKLLSFLKSTTDVDTYFRAELVDRITELAERYAPDNSWYILTMNEIFELGGSLVRESVSHNLMRFLAEGTDEEDADNEIRRFAVVSYMDLLEKPVLPDILVRVICWVLGEYSYTASEYEPEVILEELITLLERKFEDPGTKAWVLSAIGKLMSQMGQPVGSMRDVLEKYASAVDVELRQRSLEIDKLSKNTIVMQSVLPVDGCCEDLEVDESLSFMDSFVSEALANGASPYKPMSERRVEEKIKETLDQEKHLLDDEIGVKLPYQKLTGTPTASLSDDLVDFPHSHEALELCSDSNVRVTLQKVWKPGELVLVLYLTNQNQASASISDVISALEAPSNLIALFDSTAGNKLQNDNIGPLSWVRHKVVLKYQSPSLHMNFGGKICYRDPNRTLRHLFFNHTLSMKDILRPLVINTEEFGLKWTDASFEKRQKMFSSSRNCQEFSKRAEQELNIYTVEMIGGKAILAGTLMESGICLLHASCDGDSLELSIKSNNRLLNDAVIKHCVTAFR
ncbi:PREDICTED: AP-4 complex subunit epsilon-1-like [Acropora digitifera]|uniref:AP-4 complex subunit epsilon-1-like n=1 Tax=Acropora digitifera TaxID=70779 RepID=UPI00077A405B|nr:PREDICTED: AP-4 complex subunit epsilon-1-like [Acropora digitifera]